MSLTGVGSSSGLAWSSNETTETVSSSRRLSARIASEDWTSPSRSRMSMLPDRSTTRVTLTGRRSSAVSDRVFTPTRTSWVPSSSVGAIAVSAETPTASCGSGRSDGCALTHSSTRIDAGGGSSRSSAGCAATFHEPVSTSSANVDWASAAASTKPLVPASTKVLSSSGPGTGTSSAIPRIARHRAAAGWLKAIPSSSYSGDS